ncbi:putative RNA-directed DNA polymerase [Tanacetum coccineum]
MADRLSHLKTLEDMEHLKNLDLKQKAKVNLAIEEDENSKFFHGIINSKFSRSRINGISVHGSWVTDPILVTSHIFNFHKCKFQNNVNNRPRFTSNMFKKLTSLEVTLLDVPFINVGIKEAVWNYGGEKALAPDGFTFKFIKFYWDTVGNDFIDMVKHFERNGSIPKGCNSSFIASCRQIIDGPLIDNEILAWATKKKERLFILKVDFEKAFDSLDWSFLDHVMCQMGFSSKWRTWIHGCLNSAYAWVIVNGSLTKEFKIQKGLRQGEPLSPFLFIIAMEAFHVTIQEAKANSIYEGIQVGHNNVDLSHLQFTDDALIMGKWSLENAKNMCRILRCFHMSSGLKVNFSKSKFFGIGVSADDTNNFASFFNFQPSSLPCMYLGLPIGANMNRGLNWKPVIDKFHNRLSSWKAKTLSYGGRLTLIKSGGSSDSNKLAWIAWKKVCSSTKNGGLGIGSLQASNLAMLAKCRWRFHSDLDGNTLWKRVIKSTYGICGGLGLSNTSCTLQPSPWKCIIGLDKSLYKLNIGLHNIIKRKTGDGSQTSFWNDIWIGYQCLKTLFPRHFSLESTRDGKVMDRCYLDNGSSAVKWDCMNDSRCFTVSSMRKHIESFTLCTDVEKIRWNNLIPIKLNILTWRISLDRIPTRSNLDSRGIDLDSILCPVCNDEIETSQHLDCSIAKSSWILVSKCWGFHDYPKDLPSLIKWADNTNARIFDAVVQTTLWAIRNLCNATGYVSTLNL